MIFQLSNIDVTLKMMLVPRVYTDLYYQEYDHPKIITVTQDVPITGIQVFSSFYAADFFFQLGTEVLLNMACDVFFIWGA